ncbi:MAG: CaiB/BaiF CoA-transferase family protein [Gammaproteobacteria bacterium]|nr:CaiB/BaiF CoA-transferase family protein [Gammaproteobacteria bacterium]
MEYLFSGLKVIDAASFLAGPGAATVLADFGADVVKVEPTGGDGYRTLAGNYVVDYNWLLTSRNKRSIGLDITAPDGREVLRQLILGADVLLVNFRADQLLRFDLEYETLKKLNPRLIYAHMTGYGTAGEEADRRAFDATAWWARSGLMDQVRDKGQAPVVGSPGFGDHSSSMSMFGAIMMGLYRREKTGEGSYVTTSLAANGVWANGMQLQGVIAGFDLGRLRQEKGWLNPFSSVYGTNDGRFVIFAIVDPVKEWNNLCTALDRLDWITDERFSDLRTMMKNRRELKTMLQDIIGKLDLSELVNTLDSHEVTFGVVQQGPEVVADPQLIANEMIVPTGSDDPLYQWTVANPIQLKEAHKKQPIRAPDIGQHSREVLTELGFAEPEINRLIEQGIVTQSDS